MFVIKYASVICPRCRRVSRHRRDLDEVRTVSCMCGQPLEVAPRPRVRVVESTDPPPSVPRPQVVTACRRCKTEHTAELDSATRCPGCGAVFDARPVIRVLPESPPPPGDVQVTTSSAAVARVRR